MDWKDKNANIRDQLKTLRQLIPEATKGFGVLSKAVKDGGVLDYKTKEFVALGMAVAVRCEECIGLHVEALHQAGATREELGDVLAMAIQMGGGPSLMYAAKALRAWDDITA
ncbi:carboxymuconolactone decarboxylase family protein [Cereibacter sphaeroides]|uniref:carboxymuconolactone decarboxylase family protein n=1 Tax=Rhodobacterales TaxID=204455 RepID=UPI000BBE4AB5|nr:MULTISPECIES: carboxymuconolactone decarboxylase family protein [Paracoccaceae]MCE6950725.1 carboxymuconolactone decarboxylase family protein [Cereibacter sphaeroides]MCE6959744.1 carboxymuconolactone decarboxylase family protein [Cereibacter sphaeroides]MCE6968788.1 carboxymuconolactone decarboxylase family protein [Cereibacter sphaeroides]MCE6974598.1 carboxymuconolactone decarboxylase family protein [Cereibacter sphaeroides]